MKEEQLEVIESKISQLIGTFPKEVEHGELGTKVLGTDKYWYDDTVVLHLLETLRPSLHMQEVYS